MTWFGASQRCGPCEVAITHLPEVVHAGERDGRALVRHQVAGLLPQLHAYQDNKCTVWVRSNAVGRRAGVKRKEGRLFALVARRAYNAVFSLVVSVAGGGGDRPSPA